MTTQEVAASETALLSRVSALVAEGYQVSQEDATGGEFSFALCYRPADGASVYLSWEA